LLFTPMMIQFLMDTGITLLTIAGMEALSWGIHKYLFHGPLWFIHKTHHQRNKESWLEWNDLFSMSFAALSMWLMWIGHEKFDYRFWIGIGISIYGIIYFIFHDWYIHSRMRPFRTYNRYLLNIRRAHKIHHKSTERLPAEEFGLLVTRKQYFK
jgi:beta-carotene 3-hydroxylase